MNGKWMRRSAVIAACMMALAGQAADVTISLVTAGADGGKPLDETQFLWISPFGGWAASLWAFGLNVDGKPLMVFESEADKLSDKSLKQAERAGEGSELIERMLTKIEKTEAKPDGRILQVKRASSATLDLLPGRHTIHPFGIEFTLGADGTVACDNPRARVDKKAKRIEVPCHPVEVKTMAGGRSVPGQIQLKLGAVGLLGGLEKVFEEYDLQNGAAAPTTMKAGARYFVIYLPATAETPYEVNGVTFELDKDGNVKLAADAKASCVGGYKIQLQAPPLPPRPAAPRTQPIGVSWFGAPGNVAISGGSASASDETGSGSGWVEIPLSGNGRSVKIGSINVRMPDTDPRWPHQSLICDVAGSSRWTVEASPLAAKPGAEWSCRITASGKASVPASLRVALESAAGGASGGEMDLKSAAGVFTGVLPSKSGLWRLRVAATDSSPLKGQTLGLALIGEQAAAAVSLFTVHNRALFKRGTAFDLLWVARRPAGGAAAEWPVRLRGVGLDAIVHRLAIPAGGGAADVSGRLILDTTALAAGEYTAIVEADGVAGYPFRFRICQRERLSDFDVYSFAVHTTSAEPFPGSPINSYLGGTSLMRPSTAAFLADGDGALDGVFGAYANAPLGPLPEMFARPSMDERNGMAIAAMGLHNAPGWPEAHSYESCNPKHTLPENLAWVRRRMALFAQAHADYPGVDGFDYNWNWQFDKGFWGDSGPRLDAWQPEAAKQSQAAAWKLSQEMWPQVVAKYAHLKPIRTAPPEKWPKEMADIPGLSENQLRYVNAVSPNGWSLRPANTFAEWYADLNEIMPGLTHHAHVSSPGLGGGIQYWEWHGKTHRNSVDFSEYFLSPFDGWRAPAVMAMDNQERQKIQLAVQSHSMRAEDIPNLFAAAGRGVDGFAFTQFSDKNTEMIGRGRVFERFGSWFVSFDPLPDVALFWSRNGNAVRTALHDLARLRRPAIMVGPRDVEAGELLKYKVLVLLGVGDELPPETLQAFRAFEAKGGVILKDDACHSNVPGRSIGLAYEGKNVSGGWGGAQAGGEGEHVWVWKLFLEKQETLVKAFAATPKPPVTTPDTDVLLSPLAGKDSIICFVINKTEVPLEVTFPSEKSSRFRQQCVLPKIGELQVEKGWHVRNLLTGQAAPTENTAKGLRVPLELTRAEGEIYLLTRREPKSMTVQAQRTSPAIVRLTGGLADGDGKLLADPMPFEVTLKGPDGAILFHKYASIGPEHPFDLPVPAMSGDARPELVLRDLVLGTTATQALEPAVPAAVAVRQEPDLIGGEKKILEFFQRKGPVTILLDEDQEAFRPAAERMAAMLKKSGRDARVVDWDVNQVRPLPLRWYPIAADRDVLDSVTNRNGFAWRINMSTDAAFERDTYGRISKTDYANPNAGYSEGGPRLRHDGDLVLFGSPANHRALADLAPWLRRVPTDTYPAPGGFFVHYLWSPFRARYDAIYVGCRDAAGADAAMACLASLKRPEPAPEVKMADKAVVLRGGAPAPLENLAIQLGATAVFNVEYSPSGDRLFAITAALGDWLYVLDAEGKVLEKRMPPNTPTFPNWFIWGRGITPVSDTVLRLHQWNGGYMYDLTRGWVSRAPAAPQVADKKAGRSFLGDTDFLLAMDPQGRRIWTYEDGSQSPDMGTLRKVTPRALSDNGRILLVSAFAEDAPPSLVGLDAATGKVLWQRTGILLNAGTVVAMEDRFLVIADDKSIHEIFVESGKAGDAMSALTGSPDWVLQVPGKKRLLIAENSHFDRKGPRCRVYIRSLDGGADRNLSVPGRVTGMAFAPDGQSFVVASSDQLLARFASDGTLLWSVETQPALTLRFSRDAKTLVTAGNDGVVRLFNFDDGKLRRATDLNYGNSITAEQFAKQERMGDLPVDAGRMVQLPPPEPSYLQTFDAKTISFGPNLAPPERMRALLKPAEVPAAWVVKPESLGTLTAPIKLPPLKVEAGKTYLIEFLNAAGAITNDTSLLRVEIAVNGKVTTKNLPFTARLPVDPIPARRRAAFRADDDDDVTLTIRAILPNRNAAMPYEKVPAADIPVLIGDFVVAAIQFPGPNVLFDGGPGARSKPAGSITCTVYPVKSADSTVRSYPANCSDVALRLVNGLIANQKTDWTPVSGPYGPDKAPFQARHAEAVTQFAVPKALAAIAVFEDNTGPVFVGGGLRERTATRYAVDVRDSRGNWIRIGAVRDNRQLVNIFPCPKDKISGVRYIWGGREDAVSRNLADNFIRTAQIEAYAAEGVTQVLIEKILNQEDTLPPASDGF
jgi:hypothetical protein